MGKFGGRRENNFRDRDSDRRDSRDSRRPRGRFDRDFRSEGRENRFDRRDGPRRHLEMHTAICDKCGMECEVPFKPTSSKPVFCGECFGKEGGDSGPRRCVSGSGITPEQFEQLNRKLDKIMKALKLN